MGLANYRTVPKIKKTNMANVPLSFNLFNIIIIVVGNSN